MFLWAFPYHPHNRTGGLQASTSPEAKIHPVFHVSLLKKAVGNSHVNVTLPKGLEIDHAEPPNPLKRLATCTITRAGHQVLQWLI